MARGYPAGSHRSIGSFHSSSGAMGGAIPGALLYVNEPLTALNFAWPQGVIGGRSALRGAFPFGTLPLIQIPVRSCGSKAWIFAVWALGSAEGWAVWANVTDEKASIANTTKTERFRRFCTSQLPSMACALEIDFVSEWLEEHAKQPKPARLHLRKTPPLLFS